MRYGFSLHGSYVANVKDLKFAAIEERTFQVSDVVRNLLWDGVLGGQCS
jgi:hypothetical protein